MYLPPRSPADLLWLPAQEPISHYQLQNRTRDTLMYLPTFDHLSGTVDDPTGLGLSQQTLSVQENMETLQHT